MPSQASMAAAQAIAALISPPPSQTTVLAVAAALDGPLPLGAVQQAADNVATLTANTLALFTTAKDGGPDGDGMVTFRGVDGVGVKLPGYRLAVAQVSENALLLANLRVGHSEPTRWTLPAPGTSHDLGFVVGALDAIDLDLNGKSQWQGLDFTLDTSGPTTKVVFTGAGFSAGDEITARKLFVTGNT